MRTPRTKSSVKYLFPVAIALMAWFACRQPSEEAGKQRADDSLVSSAEPYRPGLGEFMSSIQLHHAKLYFAGKNQNWDLAHFEWDEIAENVEAIRKYASDRPEIKFLNLLDKPGDSLKAALDNHDPAMFDHSFQVLTNACNSCHKETGFSFNKIIIPAAPPVANQDFSPQ